MTTSPVVISVSHATRPVGSSVSTASRTESEIWSAILSGWPSVTDSDVKVNERLDMAPRLADAEEGSERCFPLRTRPEGQKRVERGQARRHLHACELQERQ